MQENKTIVIQSINENNAINVIEQLMNKFDIQNDNKFHPINFDNFIKHIIENCSKLELNFLNSTKSEKEIHEDFSIIEQTYKFSFQLKRNVQKVLIIEHKNIISGIEIEMKYQNSVYFQ